MKKGSFLCVSAPLLLIFYLVTSINTEHYEWLVSTLLWGGINVDTDLFTSKYNPKATACDLPNVEVVYNLNESYIVNSKGEISCETIGWPFTPEKLRSPEEDDLVKKRASIGAENNPSDHKLNIVILTLESTSRAKFFLVFNKTKQLMREYSTSSHDEISELSHQSFVFNRLMLQGPNTMANMAPRLSGEIWADDDTGFVKPKHGYLTIKGTPLWHTFKEYGYVTAVGTNGNSIWAFHNDSPRHPITAFPPDIFNPLKGSEYNPDKKKKYCDNVHSKTQLLFTQNFMRPSYYEGFRKFIAVHLSGGIGFHFHSFQALLDEPMYDTAKYLLEDRNTILIIDGDHGKFLHPDKLPLFAMFVPNWLLNTYPDVRENLWKNQIRPICSLDIHLTYIALATFPYENDISCVDCDRHDFGSLLEERPSTRTCPDCGISPLYCECVGEILEWYDVEGPEITSYALAKAQEHLNKFNSVFDELSLEPDSVISNTSSSCKRLEVRDVYDMKEAKYNGDMYMDFKYNTQLLEVEAEFLLRLFNGAFAEYKQITRFSRYLKCRDERFDKIFCICDKDND